MDTLKTVCKLILGESVSDAELRNFKDYKVKYELVRYLYIEKREGTGLVNFHFTPGTDFLNTPVIDIVNRLLKLDEKVANGEIRPLSFEDYSIRESNPPTTNVKKRTL